MRTITTKFVGATNTKSSRIVARCGDTKLFFCWDYDFGVEDNHLNAAKAMNEKLSVGMAENGESFEFVGSGELPDGSGNVYLFKFVRAQ